MTSLQHEPQKLCDFENSNIVFVGTHSPCKTAATTCPFTLPTPPPRPLALTFNSKY